MTNIDPNLELFIRKVVEDERQMYHGLFAIKLVEKIVFYMVGAASIAVLGAIIKLVIL